MQATTPRITCVSAMRNEGPFVLEWIAHHRALGVTDFVIHTNDCDDGTDALLDRLEGAGVVCHLRHAPRGKSVQWQALKAAGEHPAVRGADWCLAIDCDEFVNLRPPFGALPQMIAAHPGTDAFVLPWRFFGHAGHLRYEDLPVTGRFTMAIPEDARFPAVARSFKTLFRQSGGQFARLGVHRPKTRGTAGRPVWRDGSGQALPDDFAAADGRIMLMGPRIETGLVQLNHYSLRAAEDFLVKRARGLPNRSDKPLNASYWAERNFNTVEDVSIRRHSPATEAERARLAALPGVAEAHAAAVALHRAKIARLLDTLDGASLFGRLALLATSTVPEPDEADRLLLMMHKALTSQP